VVRGGYSQNEECFERSPAVPLHRIANTKLLIGESEYTGGERFWQTETQQCIDERDQETDGIPPGVLLFCCLVFIPVATRSDDAPPNEIGVTLEWDPNPEPEVAGYYVYVGTQSGVYTRVIDSGSLVVVRVAPLDPGITYYFAVTARTDDGLESPFSDEVSYTVPIDGIRAALAPMTFGVAHGALAMRFSTQRGCRYFVQATEDFLTWRTVETFGPDTADEIYWQDPMTSSYGHRFYRVVAQLQ
jgi:hypothetical protein